MNKQKTFFCLLLCLCLSACAQRTAESEAPAAESEAPAAESPLIPEPETSLRAPVISEVMTRNHAAPIDGRLVDWVELYNPWQESIGLSGFSLVNGEDGKTASLGERTLRSGEYLVLTERELGFRLSREGVSLRLLTASAREADRLDVPALGGRESFTRELGITDAPTPGRENRSENAGGSFAPSALRISEVCTANDTGPALLNEHPDWIELYNSGTESIDLGEYYLSDDHDELLLWQLPREELKPGAYRLLLLSEGDAPFSLSAGGELLYLCSGSGLVCDLLDVPYMPADCSFGREDGRELYYASPTPGSANRGGYESMVGEPTVSVPSGWYEEGFSVTLSGEGEIRYTTDGSLPGRSSRLYGGEPIRVERSMSLRVRCFDADRIPSGTVTRNYFFDALPLTLDVVKISIGPADRERALTGHSVLKSPASIALYTDGVEQFSESCGISVLGSGSRAYEKLSYQIDFRSRYGKTRLDYRVFDDLEQSSFTTLTLRSGSQDQCYACMRDELFSGIFAECSDSLLTFRYRPVSLYLNEEYRGVYYIRERCKSATVAYRDGVSKDSVEIVRNFSARDAEKLRELLNYIRTHDLAEQAYYDAVCEKMNIESVADFFIALMWTNNYDINNIRFYRSDADGGRWRLILYDMDVAFLRDHSLWVRQVFNFYSGLLGSLMRNDGFREYFTLRLGELLRGALAEERVLGRIDAFERLIENDMVYNCRRYPGIQSYEEWKRSVEELRSRKDYGVKGWNSSLIRQYISCVPLSDELIREAFGAEFVPSGS